MLHQAYTNKYFIIIVIYIIYAIFNSLASPICIASINFKYLDKQSF